MTIFQRSQEFEYATDVLEELEEFQCRTCIFGKLQEEECACQEVATALILQEEAPVTFTEAKPRGERLRCERYRTPDFLPF